MELVATPTALAKRWTGILEAARFDADRAPEAPTPGQQARDFAVEVERAQVNAACESPAVLALTAEQASLHLSGIALPEPERPVDGDIWRIVHLAAYDQARPLFAGV